MIWSDMYLRMVSPASEYYDVPLDSDPSDAVKPPQEIGLVYWDYYHDDENFYKSYLRMHRQLSEKTVLPGRLGMERRGSQLPGGLCNYGSGDARLQGGGRPGSGMHHVAG